VSAWNLLWILLIIILLQPALNRWLVAGARRRALERLARKRDATVITLIHRQETVSFLGIPLMRHIDIDDAESVLRAIRETPPGRPIEIVLHTPGGLVLAARQIAAALADHDGKVTAVVPHYAMSGGTMIALAADEILVDGHAAGPGRRGSRAGRLLERASAVPSGRAKRLRDRRGKARHGELVRPVCAGSNSAANPGAAAQPAPVPLYPCAPATVPFAPERALAITASGANVRRRTIAAIETLRRWFEKT